MKTPAAGALPGPALPARLRVLVVDPHAGVRGALAALLASAGATTPCAEAADGDQAQARLQTGGWDVALVDFALPPGGGLDLVRRLRAGGSDLPVLMLSTHAESAYALRAFEAGANGYIGKDAPAPALVAAVHAVAAGGSHVPAALADRVQGLPRGRVRVQPHARLSARERSLLPLLAEGLSDAEAARQLQIAPGEAARSRSRIAAQLGLEQAEDWRRYVQAHGLRG